MSKTKKTVAPVKKPAAKTTKPKVAIKPKKLILIEEPKLPIKEAKGFAMPVQGNKVNYTFTAEEMADYSRPAGTEKILAEVVTVKGNEVVITCEPRPGQPWQKGCFYNEKEEPGSWSHAE